MAVTCRHLTQVAVTTTDKRVCEDCVKVGDDWVHLRLCLICGHVGCCDDSKNRHATKHFRATQHPIVTSLEPGESWSWCFIDEVAMELG